MVLLLSSPFSAPARALWRRGPRLLLRGALAVAALAAVGYAQQVVAPVRPRSPSAPPAAPGPVHPAGAPVAAERAAGVSQPPPLLAAPAPVPAPEPTPATATALAPAAPRERLISPRIAERLAALTPKYDPPAKTDSPSTTAAAPELGPDGEPIVRMDPFVVTDDQEERKYKRVVEDMRQDKARIDLDAFTWKEGGTLVKTGRAEVKLKYNPEHKGFDLLNLKF